MLRSVLGGIRRQGQKRTVMWSPDVADNSKPTPDLPRKGMTDDEALKMSDEMAVIRRAKKQAYAANNHENSDLSQMSASSSKANFDFSQPLMGAANQTNYNFTQQSNIFTQIGNNNNISFNFDQRPSTGTGLQAAFNLERATEASSFPENEKKFQFGGNFVGQSITYNINQQNPFNIEQVEKPNMFSTDDIYKEQGIYAHNKNMGQVNGYRVDQQSIIITDHGKMSIFSNDGKDRRQQFQFDAQPLEDDSNIGQESTYNKMGTLSDFAVDQAAQISKLTEDEKKRKRALRFGLQPSQNRQSIAVTKNFQESEQMVLRVNDFIDTAKLYARVQNEISKKTNELGRTRAWDYFDDGFEPKTGLKKVTKVESKVEPKVESPAINSQVLEDMEEVNEPELKFESKSVLESEELHDSINVNAPEVQLIDDFSFIPVTSAPDQSENVIEVVSAHRVEEPIADKPDEDVIITNNNISEKPNTCLEDIEEEIDPAFRFTTICDLRKEVFGSQPLQSRREVSFKRKSFFKRAPIKTKNDSKPEAERLRRRKDRLAMFDANRSISKVLNELDSAIDLDTPAERLFRLEHPEYFPDPSESRVERLYEYEQARSKYEKRVAKLMAKQENRQEKSVRKRLRELEDKELLREAKKVARQKIQEEIDWVPPTDADIWKWREQKGRFPPAEDYDEKESDEENFEINYNPLEESSGSPKILRPSLRRNDKVLSYSELRRRVSERERNKKVQSDLVKMQEAIRKCQIEDLRHKVLEEERVHKRQMLIDLSNERDKRDAETIQHIREVATSKIAIGRAIRELEDKIAAVEAELSRKGRFEDMVNEQSTYMKCIRNEELQNVPKSS